MNIDDYKYITNQIFPHGMGTRVSFLINAIAFSKFENKEFIMTPFSYQTKKREFDTNPRTKTYDYIGSCTRWDTILNLDVKKITEMPNVELEKVLPLCFPSFNNTPANDYGNNGKIRLLRGEIKNEYFKITKKEKSDKVKVSVHIRRGDAISHSHRFLPNEYYIKIINIVETFLKKNNINYEVKIFTQKLGFYKNGLEKYKIYLDDEVSDVNVWTNLLNSDIIIGSNSALSTSVGMLTDGLYVHPHRKNQLLVTDWLYGSELNYDLLKKRLDEIK